jgi:hypothetical protein
MRVIRTCILKLLVDTDEPAALRGTLHIVENGDTRSFRDEQDLLALLKVFIQETAPAAAQFPQDFDEEAKR